MGVAKSIGFAMFSDIFDFSETISLIHFKLGGGVSWVGLYQMYSDGLGPVIFYIFYEFLLFIFGQILKNLYPF